MTGAPVATPELLQQHLATLKREEKKKSKKRTPDIIGTIAVPPKSYSGIQVSGHSYLSIRMGKVCV